VAGNVNASGLCLGGTCKTTWEEISGTGPWTTSGSNIYFSSGRVGIGTVTPGARLDVGAGAAARGAYSDLLIGAGGNNPQMEFYGPTKSSGIAHDEPMGGLVFYTNGPAFLPSFFLGNTGHVGVGTTAPATRLHVGNKIADDANRVYDSNALMVVHQTPTSTAALNDPKPVFYLGRQGTPSQAYGAMATFSLSRYESAGTSNVGSRTRLDIGLTHDSFSDAGVMTLLSNGKVGIGKTNPTEALDVQGNIIASGNIAAKFQDVAEWVPSTQKLSAGTVVILDVERSNHVIASAAAYDTKVAGVVSAQPGVILGEGGADKVMVATTGRVRVRVDATRAPIKVGDLLVTSDVEGVAMKSEPISIGGRQLHAPGTIVGKALEPLAKGVGEILVLLSLQ
jgi:hypothetical protein